MATLKKGSKGAFGEEIAREYLKENGFEILSTNYTSRYGEIDIIAKNGDEIIFTEVKTKATGTAYSPVEAVTPAKQAKICKTAALFMEDCLEDLQPSFAVIEVFVTSNLPYKVLKINFIDNAFDYCIE